MSEQRSILANDNRSLGILAIMRKFLEERAKNIHTQIVCRVEEVHHDKGCVDVQPLIRTLWSKMPFGLEGGEGDFPLILRVPVRVESAKRGKAIIKMPIKKGDIGELKFSERATENYLSTTGLEIVDSRTITVLSMDGDPQPLSYQGEVFTESNPYIIPEDEIIIQNEKVTTTMLGNGKVITKNDKVTVSYGEDGNISITNGTDTINLNVGSMSLTTTGNINMNGATVTSDGDVKTSDGYSLRALYEKTSSHVHGGVSTGNSNTGDIA